MGHAGGFCIGIDANNKDNPRGRLTWPEVAPGESTAGLGSATAERCQQSVKMSSRKVFMGHIGAGMGSEWDSSSDGRQECSYNDMELLSRELPLMVASCWHWENNRSI